MQKFNLSDRIGHSIFSLGFVLFPLLILIGGMLFASHTYFYAMLPDTMSDWQRTTAAWLIATAWESTVLITTANHAHVAKWIPRTMAFAVGVIMLLYLEAFVIDIWIQKLLFGTLVAFTSWTFVELFAKKWKERTGSFSLPVLLEQAQTSILDLQGKLEESERRMNTSQTRLLEYTGRMEMAETFRSNIMVELTCPHCRQQFDTFNGVHAHKGHCENNPNARKKALNGHSVLS